MSDSAIHRDGVAPTLNEIEKKMKEEMLKRLSSPMYMRGGTLSEEEIETIATIASSLARRLSANAIGQAYQMGVNSTVKPEDHCAVTKRMNTPNPGGG